MRLEAGGGGGGGWARGLWFLGGGAGVGGGGWGRGRCGGNGPGTFDFTAAAMDMTGGRGPATIAAVMDHISMNDNARGIILPAMADFLADLQEFRQTMQALPAR